MVGKLGLVRNRMREGFLVEEVLVVRIKKSREYLSRGNRAGSSVRACMRVCVKKTWTGKPLPTTSLSTTPFRNTEEGKTVPGKDTVKLWSGFLNSATFSLPYLIPTDC